MFHKAIHAMYTYYCIEMEAGLTKVDENLCMHKCVYKHELPSIKRVKVDSGAGAAVLHMCITVKPFICFRYFWYFWYILQVPL